MTTKYYKRGDNLLYISGEELEAPEGAVEINAKKYATLRLQAREELAQKTHKYLKNLKAKKLEAKKALVALGLSEELALEVIK